MILLRFPYRWTSGDGATRVPSTARALTASAGDRNLVASGSRALSAGNDRSMGAA